ncbi:hypothetical protein JWJ90_13170 [Desulfobulbus rhabdoformis]|uniref:hypothetical protein n=1 Tax=Desulfobulbus rhabdoformis TaxID=34032 RepID=UPI001966C2FE|nr:hypothetical protein [Desulfobulbus rhabdoformis]MBM9615231.1 hypothetical protein [Desulfobulbus rhabdoformis]
MEQSYCTYICDKYRHNWKIGQALRTEHIEYMENDIDGLVDECRAYEAELISYYMEQENKGDFWRNSEGQVFFRLPRDAREYSNMREKVIACACGFTCVPFYKVIDQDLWLCEDCTQAAVNADYTGLDYHYSEQEADQRYKEITEGLERLGTGLCWSGEESDEFSRKTCDCCGTALHGRRKRFVLVG